MLARYAEALLVSSYFWSGIALGQRNSPLGLIGGMAGLGELLCGGGKALLAPLQVLLKQLDPPVEGGNLTLGLGEEGVRDAGEGGTTGTLRGGVRARGSARTHGLGDNRGYLPGAWQVTLVRRRWWN